MKNDKAMLINCNHQKITTEFEDGMTIYFHSNGSVIKESIVGDIYDTCYDKPIPITHFISWNKIKPVMYRKNKETGDKIANVESYLKIYDVTQEDVYVLKAPDTFVYVLERGSTDGQNC